MFKSGYIAILGTPNAGKSTLLNRILGEKIAAVTNKPQTTRQRLIGIHTTDSAQMIFLDTPGVHASTKQLNQYMHEEVNEALFDADVLCILLALDQKISTELVALYEKARHQYPHKKVLLVLNKIDLKSAKIPLKDLARLFPGAPLYQISASEGVGVEDLLQVLEGLLPEGPAFYPEDELTDKNLRDLAAEIIREKAFELLFEEIPYSVAVEIEAFKEGPEKTHIEAHIIVEHESQKGMVIGSGGRMIKEIGTKARKDIETLVGTKVYLELRVKVDKNWTKKADRLALYGYKASRPAGKKT